MVLYTRNIMLPSIIFRIKNQRGLTPLISLIPLILRVEPYFLRALCGETFFVIAAGRGIQPVSQSRSARALAIAVIKKKLKLFYSSLKFKVDTLPYPTLLLLVENALGIQLFLQLSQHQYQANKNDH